MHSTLPEECATLCACDPDCGWWSFDSQADTCILTEDCPVVDEQDCSTCFAGQSDCGIHIGTTESNFGTYDVRPFFQMRTNAMPFRRREHRQKAEHHQAMGVRPEEAQLDNGVRQEGEALLDDGVRLEGLPQPEHGGRGPTSTYVCEHVQHYSTSAFYPYHVKHTYTVRSYLICTINNAQFINNNKCLLPIMYVVQHT